MVQHLHTYLCFYSYISTSTSLRSNKRSSSGPPGSGRLGCGWIVQHLHTYLCFSSCISTSTPLRSNKRSSSRPPGSARLGCGWIVQHLHAYLCFSSCISTSTSLRSNKRSSSRPPGSGRLGLAGPAYINDALEVQLRFMWSRKSVPWKTQVCKWHQQQNIPVYKSKLHSEDQTGGSFPFFLTQKSNRRQRNLSRDIARHYGKRYIGTL